MKRTGLLIAALLVSTVALLAQASSQENLRRATAKEIGGNTRTDDVTVSNIRRKMTSVTWNAQAGGVCYECDADDMVRSVHIVKIDCSLVPAEPRKKAEVPGGATIGNTRAATPDEAQCAKYKKLKTVGIGLSVGGGATFLTAVVLLAVGSRVSYDYFGYPYRNQGAYVAGAALIVPGMLATGAGVPLAVIGSSRAKRRCGGSASLNLSSYNNSLGLALDF